MPTATAARCFALRDDSMPYPLKIDATIGRTTLYAAGNVTSLTQFSAVDLQLALRGDSLGQLYPLLGFALPETPAYATKRPSAARGKTMALRKFTAHIGQSDMAGTLRVDTAAKRPFLQGDVVFQVLHLADLGPVIGAKKQKGSGRRSPKRTRSDPCVTRFAVPYRALG